VENDGTTTISSLNITSAGSGEPGIIISKSADVGDLSVPTGQAISFGHYAATFSEKFRIPSSGGISIYNSAGSSVVASISNTGRATIDIQDGIDFYDGTTNRGRLRASTAASRIVSDVAFNVDGLLTASAGLTVTGALTLPATSITNTMLGTSSVTAVKIAANTITSAEIATDAITAAELSDSISITTSGTMTPTGTVDITNTAGYNSVYMGGTNGVAKRFYRYTGVSEERLKENITPTSLAADAIYGLNPIDFNFRASASELYPNIEFPTTRQWGLTVENAREVFPSAVSGGQNGDPYGIHWERIYFGMLVAIKDLNARVIELESRIAELES